MGGVMLTGYLVGLIFLNKIVIRPAVSSMTAKSVIMSGVCMNQTSSVISAIIKMGGVMLTGYLVGILMGFSVISSLFLGCMLSISSTAVNQ